MRTISLALVVGAVLLSANPAFPHFVKAALGFRLGYSPAEKGYGEKLSLTSGGKKGVGVQLLTGVNNGGWQGGAGGAAAAAATGESRVGDVKAAGSSYGVGIVPSAQQSAGQGRSLGGGGPLEALGGTHGAVRHLKILGLNLYLGGRAAQLSQGLGLGQKTQVAKKPLLGGIIAGGQQPHAHGSNLITGHSPLAVLSKPISIGAGIGGKSNLLTNLGPAPNGGKNIGGLHGIRLAAGTPGFGVGLNLGLRHAINSKSPLGQVFGLGNSGGGYGNYGGPSPTKYAIGKIPFVYKGQDQAYIPGSGVLKGHGHDNNLAYSPNSLEGHESQIITAQAPLQLSVVPIHGAAQVGSQVNQQALPSQQHLQQASPQQHQGLQGPLSIPSTYRNPFLSFLRPSILRPTPLQYTFNHPQAQQTGPIRLNHSHQPHHHHHHHNHPQAHPQRPRSARPNESHSLFSGWSTLFPLGGRHKTSPSNANYFVNPLLPNGQPLTKASQASLRPGQSVPLSQAQHQVPFIQQAQHQQQQHQHQHQHHPKPQSALRGLHQQYTSAFQNLLGIRPHAQAIQQYYPSQVQLQRPNIANTPAAASAAAAAAPQQQQHQQDYNFFQLQPFQNFQSAFQVPQASPFLTANAIQSSPVQTSPITGTQFNQAIPFPNVPFTADSTPFTPPPGFQYSHSTHSQPVKMGSFTMDVDLGSKENGANNNGPLYGPLGRKLKRTNKSKSKTRSDVIIKKKDDYVEPTVQYRTYNPFQDMETSASTNALNSINAMTLSSSLGETSWTPIIHVEYPAQPSRKSLVPASKSSSSPAPTSTTTSTTKAPVKPEKKKSLPIQLSKENIKPSPPSPIGSSPSQERSMVFRRRKLNTEDDHFIPMTSPLSSTSSTSSPSTPIIQLPLASSSTSILPRLTSSSVVTTTTARPSPSPSSSSLAPSSSASASSSTSPRSLPTTTMVSYTSSPSSSSASSQSQTQTTTEPSA